MNRAMFLRELEGHLMDIPKEEREEALAFYTNYFAEAGETGIGKEFEVIKDLGSPKQVADMIKGDLASGGLKEEFTDRGVEIPTVKDELVVPPDELMVVEDARGRDNSKILLIIIAAVFAFPVIISVVMSVIGTVIGITFGGLGLIFGGIFGSLGLLGGGLGLLGGGLFGPGGLVVGFVISGASVFVDGISRLGTDLPTGMFYTGIGLGMMVLGVVGTVLILKFVFFIIKSIVNVFQRIFSRNSDGKVV